MEIDKANGEAQESKGKDKSMSENGSDTSSSSDKLREQISDAQEQQAVKRWQSRVKSAKAKWDTDFKRMRENQEFVTGLQWEGQSKMRDIDDRYTCNWTLQALQRETAQLYSRNPTAEAVRREKLDFALWDGKMQSLQEALQGVMMGRQVGIPNMQAEAIMQDFMRGRERQQLIEKVCKTFKYIYQHEIDTTRPDFKKQMKQLVRRVITCGVGYCRPHFIREKDDELTSSDNRSSMSDRMKHAKVILDKLDEDKIDETDAEVQTLSSLALSLGSSAKVDQYEESERVEFDFLPATSVIPDERCRNLDEFIAARWVFIEYPMTVEDVNEFFELEGEDRVKAVGEVMPENTASQSSDPDKSSDPTKSAKIRVWEVIDSLTRTCCYIADGHKWYLREPYPFDFPVSGFWPLVTLVFNNVEVEEGTKASIFPPSDIELLRDAQKEWNRRRDALRDQRNANAPTYLIRKGTLTKDDKNAIRNRTPNEVVELEGVPTDKRPSDMIEVLQTKGIDQALYDTRELEQDAMLAAGMQQANIGPAQPDVTATVGTIAEQSRITTTSSKVDDLDAFLSALAKMSGELLLQGMSVQTVKRIAGIGAVWPTLDRKSFLNEVELTISAASSGRPNKALEIANFERMAPFLLQAGANPLALIEEAVRRLGDERLEPSKFFPVPGMNAPMPMPGSPGPGNSGPGVGPSPSPQQPLSNVPGAMPLAAA